MLLFWRAEKGSFAELSYGGEQHIDAIHKMQFLNIGYTFSLPLFLPKSKIHK
jgi:hypothetical protein